MTAAAQPADDRGADDRGAAGRPLLLVLGTGGRDYREYLLKSISTQYRVHLFLRAEPSWERSYITGWTVLQEMDDTIRADEMIAAAGRLTAREPGPGGLGWDGGSV